MNTNRVKISCAQASPDLSSRFFGGFGIYPPLLDQSPTTPTSPRPRKRNPNSRQQPCNCLALLILLCFEEIYHLLLNSRPVIMINVNASKENGEKASLIPRLLRRGPLPQETISTLRYPLAPSEDNVSDDEKSFYQNQDVSISRQRVLRRPNKSLSCTLERLEQKGSKSEEKELFRNK